jgi:hypothetical protein
MGKYCSKKPAVGIMQQYCANDATQNEKEEQTKAVHFSVQNRRRFTMS